MEQDDQSLYTLNTRQMLNITFASIITNAYLELLHVNINHNFWILIPDSDWEILCPGGQDNFTLDCGLHGELTFKFTHKYKLL